MNEDELRTRLTELGNQAGLARFAVAVHDYERGIAFHLNGDEWFHAASVIKLAILHGVFKAVDDDLFHLDDPVHVRNRFRSAADGSIFRVESNRDGDAECHKRTGRTMQIEELARAMIVRSSNLATNLLLDLIGLERLQASLAQARVEGVRLVRGVEDNAAFEKGLNNEMTARGACQLLRAMREDHFFSPGARERMREILLAQEFNSMIPAKLPSTVRVAHKTGEISNHSHDAGVVYPVERQPYVIAIFTQGEISADQRAKAAAEISAEVYAALTA